MTATTGRNWNQIIIWGVAVIVVLAVLAWWGGVFERKTAMVDEPAPQTTTTSPAAPEAPAPATQPPPTEPPAQPTQSQ